MYKVKLNGGYFDCDITEVNSKGEVVYFDVYLHGIWLNDMLNCKTLEFIKKELQFKNEYAKVLNCDYVMGE